MPSPEDIQDFDPRSGSLLERLVFNHRAVVVVTSLFVTLILGWQALGTSINASYWRMIPQSHPYIVNFLKHFDDLKRHGNAIRVVVEANDGTILDRNYLDVLQQVNRDLGGLSDMDRSLMSSLWSPTTRWLAVTEEGFQGDLVIPDSYDGTPAALDEVRRNILLSGLVGQMVALDFRSSIIYAPLRDREAQTGQPLDYGQLGRDLETLRAKYAEHGVTLHITGFGKVVSDIIEAQGQIEKFFLLSAAISAIALFGYTRCMTSTVLVVGCSLIAVLWQVGLIAAFGGVLDPYSILVPFLIFAIGMSHGTQKMNGIMQDIGRGMHKRVAARHTFRRLFRAGLAALLSDAVGFAVLYIIDIDAIRQLAVIASTGVVVLIFTNLILLPVVLSYVGVSRSAALHSLRRDERAKTRRGAVDVVCRFVHPRWASVTILLALLMGLGALYVSDRHLSIGDLDQGAPELRPDSRYNRDNAYLTKHYQTSSDLMIVMGEVPPGRCNDYDVLERVDELEWELQQLPGVHSTSSLAGSARHLIAMMSEQNLKWYELIHNQRTLNDVFQVGASTLVNATCSLDPIYVYLTDHKAGTLSAVTEAVERYTAANPGGPVKFVLAGGNAGIEAATNSVVGHAFRTMLYWVYGVVALLCLVVFRSWRATLCAVLPLVLTSVLAEALMVWLTIGVKVATLPVVALGVGIGVDYALYLLSITLRSYQNGIPLKDAYGSALLFSGRVMFLTGFALSIGVITWVASPIKFQADMGVLLSFMFLFNMLGALVLLPSLASFLLPPSPAVNRRREVGGSGRA